ncbi:MAG TPA: hypothetical protein VJG66_03650 [Patescibacteria group bacterium]|nr:hypothetical protein [Patescibacteria group bacterium]
MSRDRIAENITTAGLAVLILGVVAFCGDGIVGVIAAGEEASKPASEQTHPIITGHQERRGPVELGVVLAGILTTHLGVGSMVFRGTPQASARRSIVNS